MWDYFCCGWNFLLHFETPFWAVSHQTKCRVLKTWRRWLTLFPSCLEAESHWRNAKSCGRCVWSDVKLAFVAVGFWSSLSRLKRYEKILLRSDDQHSEQQASTLSLRIESRFQDPKRAQSYTWSIHFCLQCMNFCLSHLIGRHVPTSCVYICIRLASLCRCSILRKQIFLPEMFRRSYLESYLWFEWTHFGIFETQVMCTMCVNNHSTTWTVSSIFLVQAMFWKTYPLK